MIHEISPHRFNNEFLQGKKVEDNDYILHYQGDTLLLGSDYDMPEIPRLKDLSVLPDKSSFIFLFRLDDRACFLAPESPGAENTRFSYRELSFFRSTRYQEVAWIAMAGYHLATWYAKNRYCGKCGGSMRQKIDERALICHLCYTVVYPSVSPAVIAAIVCKDRILLARGPGESGGWYSLIAGYADIGETLEEALIREAREEVGLDIWNIRYYKSQPWPLSGSMMIGFVAEADDSRPIIADPREIGHAAWFTRGSLPEHSLNLSIAGEMIEKFEKGELT